MEENKTKNNVIPLFPQEEYNYTPVYVMLTEKQINFIGEQSNKLDLDPQVYISKLIYENMFEESLYDNMPWLRNYFTLSKYVYIIFTQMYIIILAAVLMMIYYVYF